MDRRDFIKTSALSAGFIATGGLAEACKDGTDGSAASEKLSRDVGKAWKGWKKGHFQAHFIFTGVAESIFMIFPDGTTMLLDCGDLDAYSRSILKQTAPVPRLPHPGRHSAEWIARYVQRVNPNGNDVDYMMLSHYHSDHAGTPKFYADKDTYDGEDYFYSGFPLAAKYLNFKKAIDRLWPDYNDPLPMPDDYDGGVVYLMKRFYKRMIAERGMEVEKFRVGDTGQIKLLRAPGEYPDFSVFNICGNGRICGSDGVIRDLYAERIAAGNLTSLNENGMSLGMMFSYGPFRFFTAGDFSDGWKLPDGSRFSIEEELGKVCGSANVAKITHHGHRSMPSGLVGALRSQAYSCCVWDFHHTMVPVLQNISDKGTYSGDRVVCSQYVQPETRAELEGTGFGSVLDPMSYEAGHVVLDVVPGGKDFSISYITPYDESMTVKKVLHFKTEQR